MADLLGGMALATLGFIVLQLSRIFSIYSDNPEKKNGVPWNYLVMLILGCSLIASGVVIVICGFI